MASPNLGIEHIAIAQNQPEVTANGAIDALDDAENLLVSFANADADMTLTQSQLASGGCIKITGALTADRHVNLPASIGRSFIFVNATTGGHNLIVQVTGAPGTTATIAASAGLVKMYSDGTNVTQLTSGGGGGGGCAHFADAEVPSGSGTAWTLAHSPVGSSLQLFVMIEGGAGQLLGPTDYALSGATITLVSALPSGATLLAYYRY